MKILAKFAALGMDCVPWSVPDIGVNRRGRRPVRFTKQDPRFLQWRKFVQKAARRAMERSAAITGPVMVRFIFYVQTPPGHRHGELWIVPVEWNPDAGNGAGKWVKKGKSSPDILNLFKGTEDALENVIYANDVQTCVMSSIRLYGPQPGVEVEVYEIQPGDFPGSGEPIHDTEGEIPKPVRVRGKPDRTALKGARKDRKPRRANPKRVAVPREESP